MDNRHTRGRVVGGRITWFSEQSDFFVSPTSGVRLGGLHPLLPYRVLLDRCQDLCVPRGLFFGHRRRLFGSFREPHPLVLDHRRFISFSISTGTREGVHQSRRHGDRGTTRVTYHVKPIPCRGRRLEWKVVYSDERVKESRSTVEPSVRTFA